jgi:hypothetical protein
MHIYRCQAAATICCSTVMYISKAAFAHALLSALALYIHMQQRGKCLIAMLEICLSLLYHFHSVSVVPTGVHSALVRINEELLKEN